MRKGSRADQELVVNIITTTFASNPGVNWMFRKGGDPIKKLTSLADYVFIKALLRDGIYISSNEKGVAICYQYNKSLPSLTELFYQIRFVLTSVSPGFIPSLLRRESYRKRIRPKSGAYLYFWFLGVMPGGDDAGFELKNAIFNEAREKNLPIYLETAIKRNQQVYDRIGFKTYHHWVDKKQNIQFWFMKWEPSTLVSNKIA